MLKKCFFLFNTFVIGTSFAITEGQLIQELEKQLPKQLTIPEINFQMFKSKQKKRITSETIKFFIKEIKVEGASVIPSEEIQHLVKPYENKKISLKDLQEIAQEITNLYRSKGFFTSFAYIPPQEIRNQTVVIKVLEGKIEKIKVSAKDKNLEKWIENFLSPIEGKVFNLYELERKLLLIRKNLLCIKSVGALLSAGKEKGTSDLKVTAIKDKTFQFTVGYNNYGSKETSKNRIWFDFKIGCLLPKVYSDKLDIKVLTGLDRLDWSRLHYFKIDYSILLNTNGLRGGLYYTNSGYDAGKDLEILDLKGKADVWGVYLEYPLYLG